MERGKFNHNSTRRDNRPPVLPRDRRAPHGTQILHVRSVGLIHTLLESGNGFEGFPSAGSSSTY